ncbi:hypothetical protein AB0C40_23520 [Streptomyces brevispora]|uniref:hypothetical protein n=1 Tax=Streptomyces brevispora TaxID=887462 RepID=UPI0033D019B9
MRQLSVPVRWAAVTAVTIAASTGCMSVGADDEKPAPSRSAVPKGPVTAPDGSTVAGTGRGRTGGAEAHSEREAAESGGPKASADPSAGPGAGTAGQRRLRGGRLLTPTTAPLPSGPGEPEPPVTPAPSDPPAPEPSVPPEPEPEPSEPPPVPSASPAAQFRNDAMGALDDMDEMRTPEASPQVGPA